MILSNGKPIGCTHSEPLAIYISGGITGVKNWQDIFKAASAFRLSFNKNESRFLLCLNDNLHNVPELAKLFIGTVRKDVLSFEEYVRKFKYSV